MLPPDFLLKDTHTSIYSRDIGTKTSGDNSYGFAGRSRHHLSASTLAICRSFTDVRVDTCGYAAPNFTSDGHSDIHILERDRHKDIKWEQSFICCQESSPSERIYTSYICWSFTDVRVDICGYAAPNFTIDRHSDIHILERHRHKDIWG
jgi:hypothetical protein